MQKQERSGRKNEFPGKSSKKWLEYEMQSMRACVCVVCMQRFGKEPGLCSLVQCCCIH